MGTAKTSPVPDWCSGCQADTVTSIDLNRAGQLVCQCGKCKAPKGNGALTKPMVGTGDQMDGGAPERAIPLAPPPRAADPGNVVQLPMRGPLPAASVRVIPGAVHYRESAGGFSTTDIVEGARVQLAELDAQIPALEAELAAAKTHRNGLAKMIAAYDSVAPRRAPAAPAIVDPGPPRDAPIEATVAQAPTPEPTPKPARKRVGGRFVRGERKTT